MNQAVESVSLEQEMSLRLDRAPARSRCHEWVVTTTLPEGPVPPVAPDDFTVIIGAIMSGATMRGLEREMEALGGPEAASGVLIAVLQWVEDVFWRCVEVRKDRGRLRGQVMAVAAALAGEP